MGNENKPWGGVTPSEKAERALEQLRETTGVEEIPAALRELAGSENGLHDLCLNLRKFLEQGTLDTASKHLVAIAVASATGSAPGTQYLSAVGRGAGLAPDQVLDTIAVASVCTIFNGYYRFRDQAPPGEFDAFRAPFNANTFMKSALTPRQVELVCIVVSSLNGCHLCVQSHHGKALKLGLTHEQIDEAVKTGAVAAALATTIASLS